MLDLRNLQRSALDSIVRHSAAPSLAQRAQQFSDFFEPFLPRESQVLDIGGGWGFYAEPLAKKDHFVTVLDVVRPAYQKAPVVVYDPAEPFPFPDKSFDASMLITVLHHIPDPEAVLREAVRVTRSRVIVIEDLYRHAWGRQWTILRDRIYNFEFFGHPCQFHTAGEWQEIFQKTGLQVREFSERYTWLCGARILNGIFILDVS